MERKNLLKSFTGRALDSKTKAVIVLEINNCWGFKQKKKKRGGKMCVYIRMEKEEWGIREKGS